MPSTLEKDAQNALLSKLKQITHLDFLTEAYHLRVLLIGLEKTQQASIAFGYFLYAGTEQASNALYTILHDNQTYIISKILAISALTLIANYLISTTKMPTLETNVDSFKPLFATSLLRYVQENKKISSSCHQLMTLLSPRSAVNPIGSETPTAPVTVNSYHDIHHQANSYFQLRNHSYVRFNERDLNRLYPNKKNENRKKDIQALYEAIKTERSLHPVTAKETKNQHSPFCGMEVKLKSTAHFNAPRLGLVLRLPTIDEVALGITNQVYSPKAVVQSNRRY